MHRDHIAFTCFASISKESVTSVLYSINRLVLITEMESIYYAVCTESLHETDTYRLQTVKVKNTQQCWKDSDRVQLKDTRRETGTSAALSTTDVTWTRLGLGPCLSGNRPALKTKIVLQYVSYTNIQFLRQRGRTVLLLERTIRESYIGK
jgi:hypothetical protein